MTLISFCSLATAFYPAKIRNYSQVGRLNHQLINGDIPFYRMPENRPQTMRNPCLTQRFAQKMSLTELQESGPNNRAPNSVVFSDSLQNVADDLSTKSNLDLAQYFYGAKDDAEKTQVAACLLSSLVNNGSHSLVKACIFISLLDPHKHYREWFAEQLFTKDRGLLGRYLINIELPAFCIDAYAQKLSDCDPGLLLEHCIRFIPDADKRKAMIPSLIERAPTTFFHHCEKLEMHEFELQKYAQQYFREATEAFAYNIQKFNLSIEQRMDYAVNLAAKSPEVLRNYLQSFRPHSMSTEIQEAILQALFGESVPKKGGWLSAVATSSQLKALIDMGCWIQRAVRLHECPLLKHDKIADLIQCIVSIERPEHHYKMLHAFEQLVIGAAEWQSEYVALTESLSRYGLPQSMLIHQIIRSSSLSLDEKKYIIQDYGNKGFKNAFKLSKQLAFLIRLESLADKPDIQSRLLLATCPSLDESDIGKKQVMPKLLANINLMQVVVPLIETGFAPADIDLTKISSPKTLLESVKQLAVFVLGHEPTEENILAIENYFDRIDDPSCLLVWAARQHEFCKKSPMQGLKNLESVKELSHWIIHNDHTARYQKQKTLPLLKEQNEQAYRRWCELETQPNLAITPANIQIDYAAYSDNSAGVELEFDGLIEGNDIDKLGKLMALSRKSGWEAKVTSSLDDILTCGTHVPGSCQHVNADGSLNQGLIGYMKAAKMAGVWQTDKLFGRNMLFLGWDPKQNKHVIVMARNTYGQPECDDGYRELIKLASQKYADWVGLELTDSNISLRDPLDVVALNIRTIVIPLSEPTYFDGLGVCCDDISLNVK